MFILTSDHGEEIGDRGGWLHDQSVYEELIRVPLIIHFPGGQYGGRRISGHASLLDVVPTVMSFLNHPGMVRNSRGLDLMPLLREETVRNEKQMRISSMRINRKKYFRPYKESRGDVNVVVQKGHYKGILNVETDSFELYDIMNDSSEHYDRSCEKTGLAAEMQTFAEESYEKCLRRSEGTVMAPDLSMEEMEALRKLGYID